MLVKVIIAITAEVELFRLACEILKLRSITEEAQDHIASKRKN